HHGVQPFDLAVGDGRARLVQQQDLRAAAGALGDLDQLAEPDRQAPHRRLRIDLDLEDIEDLACLASHRAPVEQAGSTAQLPADEEILLDLHVHYGPEFL